MTAVQPSFSCSAGTDGYGGAPSVLARFGTVENTGIKSWDALQIGLPQVVVTGAQLEDTGKAELDIDQAEDENMDIR